MFEDPEILFAVVAGLCLIAACAALGMVLRFLRLRCQLSHIERMKALESGIPAPTSGTPDHSPTLFSGAVRVAFWMGGVFPLGAIWAAAWATSAQERGLGHVLTAWIAALLACVAAVVCATVILIRLRPRPNDPPT
ncbi:MAG: hypothetical protein ACLQNE_12785 [Thermoguttaceae bacterium]|jgi:hypothetical protein